MTNSKTLSENYDLELNFDSEETEICVVENRNSNSAVTENCIQEKTVTTKELAESLGVDIKTIQRAVSSLDINVERVGRSHTMIFTEEQATAIKIALQNHSKVAQNGFTTLTISNDLEMMLMQQKLNQYQSMRIAELQRENEEKQKQIVEMKPDADYGKAIQVDETSYFTMDKVASHLGLPYGRNTLLHNLRFLKILKSDNQPYEQYRQFGIISTVKQSNAKNFTVPLANAKGEKFILKHLTNSSLLQTKAG